jgi:hypothetical protein
MEHNLTLRQVSVDGGELVVRFTTDADLRLASKELLLLKRELRSQRRVLLAKARADIQDLRLSTPATYKSYLAVMKGVAQAPVLAIDAQIRAVEAAENQLAAAILSRQAK